MSGTAYSTSLSGSGGQPPYQWTIAQGSLPSGLQLNHSTGVLNGTPTAEGQFPFQIGLSDRNGSSVQQKLTLSVTSSAACAPPTYACARTDTDVTALPDTLPNWGGLTGANTQFVDQYYNPNYAVAYTRVTDANTGSALGNTNSGFAVGSGSGDDAHFNADESLFTVTDSNAAWYVFGLNRSTMQTGLVWASTATSNIIWSQSNRNYAYEMSNVGTGIYRMDFTGCSLNGPTCNPNVSLFYDFANCGFSGQSFFVNGGIGGNDAVFSGAADPQDTNNLVVSYNSSTGNCYLYNTETGAVTEYNDANPGGVSVGTVNITDRSSVHNVRIDPSGTWLLVELGTSCYAGTCYTEKVWQVGTTNVVPCEYSGGSDSGWCEGHNTQTAHGWLNADENYNFPASPSLLFRTWAEMSTTNYADVTQLNTINYSFSVPFDDHPTTKNDPLGTHAYPVFSSTYTPESAVGAITNAYSNEVIAWTQTPGPPLRFGHTFNSSLSPSFTAQYAIGAVSPLGDFYLYTTDGEGTLGNNSGESSCSVTAGTCRSDVFLMSLTPVGRP